MIIYVYTKCSTCQKALRFLETKQIAISVKEIVKETPSVQYLNQMLDYQNGQIKKLFNTSGQVYRELKLSEKVSTMNQEQLLMLLHQNGMLIKRPFLLGDDFGLVGFKENEWATHFQKIK